MNRTLVSQSLVRIYHRGELIKTHPRIEPGGRSTDGGDFPEAKRIYAQRDTATLQHKADKAGPAVGEYARRLLDTPAPWQAMRWVYRLLGLVRRYGAQPVEVACERALEFDVVDVMRIDRMVSQALEKTSITQPERPRQPDNVVQLRFARPPSHFSLNKETDP